jgi:hypothetical protein
MIVIDSGYFVAALEIEDDKVVNAAPIVKYMMGWSTQRVRNYAHSKNWKLDVR